MASVHVHPEIEALREVVPTRHLTGESLAAARAMPRPSPYAITDRVERVDHEVPGEPPVGVRVHTPVDSTRTDRGCLLTIHGGGYVLGSIDSDDAKLDEWCQRFDIVGVSVDYRLAPETPYPGPLDDCYHALAWVYEHAEMLGIDSGRIGIAGSSAGGGLCAGLAIRARDRGDVPVQFQLLDCPMIDPSQSTVSSQLDDLMVWTRQSNEFGWRSYLGELYGSDALPPDAAAGLAVDLRGLPEAYVSVGGADGFRDEDIAYALRLQTAGVTTELHLYPGAPHGVSFFAGTGPAERYRADQTAWLGRQFARLEGT